MLTVSVLLNHIRMTAFLLLMAPVQLLQGQVNLASKVSGSTVVEQLSKRIAVPLDQYDASRLTAKNGLQSLLQDSVCMDSLGQAVLKKVQRLTSVVHSVGGVVYGDVLQTSGQVMKQQTEKVMMQKDLGAVVNRFAGMLQPLPVEWKAGNILVTGQSVPLSGNEKAWTNNTVFTGAWSVMGVPMGMQVSEQDITGINSSTHRSFSFVFDKEAYLNSLRDKLTPAMDISGLLPDYKQLLKTIETTATAQLRTLPDSFVQIYKNVVSKQLSVFTGAEDLLHTDLTVLEEKLLSAAHNISAVKSRLLQMQQPLTGGQLVTQKLYDSLLQRYDGEKEVHTMMMVIKSFRDKAQHNLLLMGKKSAQDVKQQLLQDPDKLKILAKQKLTLTTLQKIFLNMNQFSVGRNTMNLSPLTIDHFANSGINAAFLNNNKYLFVMAAKQLSINNLCSSRPAMPVYQNSTNVLGASFGRGDMKGPYNHISLFSYLQTGNKTTTAAIDNIPGTAHVLTFSNQVKWHESGCIDIEISRSLHTCSNQKIIDDSIQQAGFSGRSGSNDLLQQMAFTVQWAGSQNERTLRYNFHVSSTGKAYNNPGNLFMTGGTTSLGADIARLCLRNRLQVSVSGNFNQYSYNNPLKQKTYRFVFQGKWKFKRGQNASLRYQSYQSLQTRDGNKVSLAQNTRLMLDGNIRRRFGTVTYQHSLALAAVKTNYPAGTGTAANTPFLLNSMQTACIDKKIFYLNTQFGTVPASSGIEILNRQFNIDAGCMYSFFGTMSFSSAINYNSIKGWWRQAGLKQTISGHIGKKYTMSMYADIVKDVKVYKQYPVNNSHLEWSIQYLIK